MEKDMDLDFIKKSFRYEPKTGLLFYKEKINILKEIGEQVGNKTSKSTGNQQTSYLKFGYNNKEYSVHRLCFIIHNNCYIGKDLMIDHVDGNGLNNKPKNLRVVSNAENCKNRARYKSNSTGVSGVHMQRGKYRAEVRTKGERHRLGYFETLEEAEIAVIAKRKELGFNKNHGRNN